MAVDAEKVLWERYQESGFSACPFCGSENIDGVFQTCGDEDRTCLQCGNCWVDIHDVVAIHVSEPFIKVEYEDEP